MPILLNKIGAVIIAQGGALKTLYDSSDEWERAQDLYFEKCGSVVEDDEGK